MVLGLIRRQSDGACGRRDCLLLCRADWTQTGIRHGPRYETLIAHFQNRAIGFSGDPVPPGTVSGAAVIEREKCTGCVWLPRRSTPRNRNYRRSGFPLRRSKTRWIGCTIPSTAERQHIRHTSLPTTAISRFFSHGRVDAWSPATFRRVPRALLGSPSPPSRPDQHDIPAGNSNAGLLLPRVQILGIDSRTGFQVGHAFQFRLSIKTARVNMPFRNPVTASLPAPLPVTTEIGKPLYILPFHEVCASESICVWARP